MMRLAVKSNDLAKIATQLGPAVSAVVQSSARNVSAGAKQRARRGTGALAAGFYTRHDGPFHSHVSNGVFYWRFHEYGTHKMAAHPMVHPAVEAERQAFLFGVTAALQGRSSITAPMF